MSFMVVPSFRRCPLSVPDTRLAQSGSRSCLSWRGIPTSVSFPFSGVLDSDWPCTYLIANPVGEIRLRHCQPQHVQIISPCLDVLLLKVFNPSST